MKKAKILYLSFNDGSDTRINKEIRSLVSDYQVYFLGIGSNSEYAFVEKYCTSFNLVRGHQRKVWSLFIYYVEFLKLYFRNRFNSIHIINEPSLLLLSPILAVNVNNKIVLDIFDSIFLKASDDFRLINRFVQDLLYKIPDRIIVTDENRKKLLPEQFRDKSIVVRNFPYSRNDYRKGNGVNNEICIFYYGTLNSQRGTEILLKTLESSSDIRIKMAGWISDTQTELLSKHRRVEYLGVLTQEEALNEACKCDYLAAFYEPSNQNNINASPNKIYDAIQCRVPVITNRELRIAPFVEKHRIGVVIDNFYQINIDSLVSTLFDNKESFVFLDSLAENCTWESQEYVLLEAHTT